MGKHAGDLKDKCKLPLDYISKDMPQKIFSKQPIHILVGPFLPSLKTLQLPSLIENPLEPPPLSLYLHLILPTYKFLFNCNIEKIYIAHFEIYYERYHFESFFL